MIKLSTYYFESKTEHLITKKFYLGLGIIIGILGLILGIMGQQPIEIIFGIIIPCIVLLFVTVSYGLELLIRKMDEKFNYKLEFDRSELRIYRKKGPIESYVYGDLRYRAEPEIIDEEGRLKNLHITDEEFNEVCETIVIMDSKDNEVISCNLGCIEKYDMLLEDVASKITPWTPETKLIEETKVFSYSKIPIICTILSIVFYFISLGILVELIEADFLFLGSLTGALIYFMFDTMLFSLYTLICYMTAKPGSIFPITLTREGLLFSQSSAILPWDHLDIYYYGLKRPNLRIQCQNKSITFNPMWVKNYSEFRKATKPHLRYTGFLKKKKTKNSVTRRILIKNLIAHAIKEYQLFLLISALLLVTTSNVLIFTPIVNSMHIDYSNQLIFQNSDTTLESFSLSSPIAKSYKWELAFTLVGNIAAYEIFWNFQTEYDLYSNLTSGIIDYRMVLKLNRNTNAVVNRTAYSTIEFTNSSYPHAGWSNYKGELDPNYFQEGDNIAEFTVIIYSNYLLTVTETGRFNWNTSGFTLTFNAVNTGDGIPEAAKLFPGFNAYITEAFILLALLPFASVIDMRFKKIRIT